MKVGGWKEQPVQLWQANATPAAPAADATQAPAADATATPAPEDELEVEDVFGTAFAELTADDHTPPPVVEEKPATAKAAAQGVLPDPKTVGTDGTVEGQAPAATTEQAPAADATQAAQGAAPAATPPAQAPVTPLTPEALAAAIAKAIPQPAPQPAPKAEAAPEPFSPEEKQIVDAYEKEWPEIARAEQLIRRSEYQQVTTYIFSQIAPFLQQQQQRINQLTEALHARTLQERVGDVSQDRDKIAEWVNSQPAYLRTAYTHVMQQGTADEVVDLINRYREATGAPAPAAAPAATQVVPPAATQAAPAAAAAAPAAAKKPPVSNKTMAALTPVKTARTAVPQDGIVKDDFDGAFAEFAKSA